MIKLGVLGAKGRMGRAVVEATKLSKYAGKIQVSVEVDSGGRIETLLSEADAIIDFSTPAAAVALAQAADKDPRPPVLVVGSTGWKIDERRVLEKYAEKSPVIISANFSTGVLAMMEVLKRFSTLFDKLGYSPVIVETHHKHKVDSPSGTALSLQRMASLSPGNVQIHAVRVGEVIGDHEVTFHSAGDRIQLAHYAGNRSIFATGALDAAIWLYEKRETGKIVKGMTGMEPYFKDLLEQVGMGTAK